MQETPSSLTMFFAFTTSYRKSREANRESDTPPAEPLFYTTSSHPLTDPRTTQLRSYAIATDVYVKAAPEDAGDHAGETWVVDKQPTSPLARGHIATLRTPDHMVGSGRVSKVVAFTRHWVILRLASGRDGRHIRVPIPWVHLGTYDSFVYMSLYNTLSPFPEPHGTYRDRPSFANTAENPYEFDLNVAPLELERLRNRMVKDPRVVYLLESVENVAAIAGS
ncbi:uncharacterized protein C8Q71DRAFT_550995 [Rhodofomes roseus]|uniref:Uncharacterized protein n=1 Tax=Rhodofomes roseus TaxID=34475 RepID=A0ABQ8KHX0_9APHY|nr:uncharacterized protein C8Q71DRAFT_550995 [Rhodofomes roseus]KAH9837590.1 hypothetical protein C8Q71DRAFT_550995 [Rhodofomes roseus]